MRQLIDDRVLQHERPQEGGLWLRTLCERCNGIASKCDGAYGEFAAALSPYLLPHELALPMRNGVPPIPIAPGRVARSVLHGMIALTPGLRLMHSEMCDSLLDDADEIRLPEGLQLRLALTSDSHARIASAYHYYRVLGQRIDYTAFAEVYFRPLFWILTSRESAPELSLPNLESWGNATDWICYSRDALRLGLRDVLDRLEITRHPSRRASRDQWLEIGGSGYVLEGEIH